MKEKVLIIGCGKLGAALAIGLSKKDFYLSFVSQNIESAKKLAQITKSKNFSNNPISFSKDSDLIFITTPDDKIQEVCEYIVKNNGFKKGANVFHCAGVENSELLISAKKQGLKTTSFHPIQSFTKDYKKNLFKGSFIGIEGDLKKAKEIANLLGANYFKISKDNKALYHSACVSASNFLVVLIDFAFNLLKEAKITDNQFSILKPLIYNTLNNIEKLGIKTSLTGPILRGDIKTIEKHLSLIKKNKNLMNFYKSCGLENLKLAQSISKNKNYAKIKKLL